MSYNGKNYSTDGGNTWVVGGSLVIEDGATVTGLSGGVTPAENQEASTAETAEALAADFNALLVKLKAAGLMAADA